MLSPLEGEARSSCTRPTAWCRARDRHSTPGHRTSQSTSVSVITATTMLRNKHAPKVSGIDSKRVWFSHLTAGLALRKGPDTAGCGGGLPLSVLSPPQMHLLPPGPSKPPGHSPELPITTPALAIRSFGHWEKSITLPDLDPNLNPKVSQPT